MKQCCVTWVEMAKSLSAQEREKLDALVTAGTPKYALAVAYETIGQLGNFCPCCGSLVAKDEVKVVTESVITTLVETPQPITPPPVKGVTCPVCKGTKYVSEDVKCNKCQGRGVLDASNTPYQVSDARIARMVSNADKASKLPLREDAKPENWDKI